MPAIQGIKSVRSAKTQKNIQAPTRVIRSRIEGSDSWFSLADAERTAFERVAEAGMAITVKNPLNMGALWRRIYLAAEEGKSSFGYTMADGKKLRVHFEERREGNPHDYKVNCADFQVLVRDVIEQQRRVNDHRLLTPLKAAEVASVSRRTVRNWVLSGIVECEEVAGVSYIRRASLRGAASRAFERGNQDRRKTREQKTQGIEEVKAELEKLGIPQLYTAKYGIGELKRALARLRLDKEQGVVLSFYNYSLSDVAYLKRKRQHMEKKRVLERLRELGISGRIGNRDLDSFALPILKRALKRLQRIPETRHPRFIRKYLFYPDMPFSEHLAVIRRITSESPPETFQRTTQAAAENRPAGEQRRPSQEESRRAREQEAREREGEKRSEREERRKRAEEKANETYNRLVSGLKSSGIPERMIRHAGFGALLRASERNAQIISEGLSVPPSTLFLSQKQFSQRLRTARIDKRREEERAREEAASKVKAIMGKALKEQAAIPDTPAVKRDTSSLFAIRTAYIEPKPKAAKPIEKTSPNTGTMPMETAAVQPPVTERVLDVAQTLSAMLAKPASHFAEESTGARTESAAEAAPLPINALQEEDWVSLDVVAEATNKNFGIAKENLIVLIREETLVFGDLRIPARARDGKEIELEGTSAIAFYEELENVFNGKIRNPAIPREHENLFARAWHEHTPIEKVFALANAGECHVEEERTIPIGEHNCPATIGFLAINGRMRMPFVSMLGRTFVMAEEESRIIERERDDGTMAWLRDEIKVLGGGDDQLEEILLFVAHEGTGRGLDRTQKVATAVNSLLPEARGVFFEIAESAMVERNQERAGIQLSNLSAHIIGMDLGSRSPEEVRKAWKEKTWMNARVNGRRELTA